MNSTRTKAQTSAKRQKTSPIFSKTMPGYVNSARLALPCVNAWWAPKPMGTSTEIPTRILADEAKVLPRLVQENLQGTTK